MTKAISGLPKHTAPDFIWEKIAAELDMEKGLVHLDNAIQDFKKDRKPPEWVWGQIAAELDILEREGPLRKAITELPKHQAPDIFDEVAPKQSKQVFLNQGFRWVSGIAASLLILFGVYYITASQEQVDVVATTETSQSHNEVVKAAISQLGEDDEILEVIEVHCAQVALRCESPEFKGLFDYYLELDASKEELLTAMNEHQEQVQLVDYLVRVQKEKDDVGKQLIQLIIG
ncbi:MAG: hypothetical protein RJQ09_19105 [Cyclobacteriaceae bacterium]